MWGLVNQIKTAAFHVLFLNIIHGIFSSFFLFSWALAAISFDCSLSLNCSLDSHLLAENLGRPWKTMTVFQYFLSFLCYDFFFFFFFFGKKDCRHNTHKHYAGGVAAHTVSMRMCIFVYFLCLFFFASYFLFSLFSLFI